MTADRAARADARANRARIVAAARALYAEAGPEVSFNAIAQRAGVGNATLYRHFNSQEELRDAVYLARIHEAETLLTDLAALGDPAVELRRYLGWVLETADLSLVGLEMAPRPRSASVERAAMRLVSLLDAMVERARAAGVLHPRIERNDVLVAAAALVHVARHDLVPRARAVAFREVLLRGLGPHA